MTKELYFVHITKTAGTAIEKSGIENGINWGKFSEASHKYIRNMSHREMIHFWHIPTADIMNIDELKKIYDFFTVVRNPYDRCISEIYWWEQIVLGKREMTKDQFNEKICYYINNHNIDTPVGHWYPQYNYVYDYEGKKIVDHVLKFEDLPNNFDELMEKYNLNIKLNKVMNKTDRIYTIEDLNPETLKIIETYYAQDFKTFGYEFYNAKIFDESEK